MKADMRPVDARGIGLASPADPAEQSLYEIRRTIHPRSVRGWFAAWRWTLVWATQLVFYGTAWLDWNGRQAVLFDLVHRKFYIFGLVFWPQDFIYLTALLVISALSLFLFTAVAGRLWCGYACPQTVYTEIFMWVERKIEGDRNQRMKLDAGRLTTRKFGLKAAKHAVWAAIALWTGFTFVGYFTPIHELWAEAAAFSTGPWETFWIFFYAFATYGNAGWMREQVCKHMCPYARFQSAMFDHDTLIVTYDEERGEPRGARSRTADPVALNLGACVDCTLCVQVCPTGIDIRKGLQYECIGCGACADVCDSVMDKLGYARGLVKYSTQNAIKEHWSAAQTLRHVLRPRVLIYTTILGAVVLAMGISLAVRTPFKVDVVRDRGALARIVPGGRIENVFRLQVMNATESQQRYRISAEGMPGLSVASEDTFEVASTQSRWIALRVQLPYEGAAPGSHTIYFHIVALDSAAAVSEKSVFLVPH